MFLVVCEGAVRKWIAPGLQAEVYLVKDALLVLAYIGFLSSPIPTGIHLKAMTGLTTLLTFSLVYFALELCNPNSPSILLSIIGLKNYLLYVPLAFVVPYMFSSSKDLEHKLKKYAIIMIPFAALGLVQFAFGPDHWLNDYVSHDPENERMLAMFGAEDEKARTTGTFSYPAGYTAFLTVMLYLGVALAAGKKWQFSGNLWPWILVVVSIAAVFTTGSRAPIYASVLTAPVVLYVWTSRGIISTGNFMKVGLAGALIAIVVTFIASSAIDAYSYRAGHSDDPIDRLLSPLTETYGVLGETPIIGAGLASTAASAMTIMGTKDYWWLGGIGAEQEPARVLQEAGVIGFLLTYAVRIWLLVKAISLGRWFRTPVYAAMAGVIAGFFAQELFLVVINNPTVGLYYWFAAGLLFAMYRLELQGATAVALPALASKRQQLRRAAPSYGVR
jgi:hypothetical protein